MCGKCCGGLSRMAVRGTPMKGMRRRRVACHLPRGNDHREGTVRMPVHVAHTYV